MGILKGDFSDLTGSFTKVLHDSHWWELDFSVILVGYVDEREREIAVWEYECSCELKGAQVEMRNGVWIKIVSRKWVVNKSEKLNKGKTDE